ncbi:hypothetical protein BLOT_007157 [Blomia tropicalis]|nr:hypothetical protein BLOT_007157 [Blomia tropicalis]
MITTANETLYYIYIRAPAYSWNQITKCRLRQGWNHKGQDLNGGVTCLLHLGHRQLGGENSMTIYWYDLEELRKKSL